ncbi:hypothetical protein [Rhizobium hainanense]|nr:hypothetical protein [Rhizobium hainanense]
MFEHTHPALMSVLALARTGAAISNDPGDAVKFGGGIERQVMEEYFKPVGGSPDRPYYVPFGEAQGKTRWREKKYPGSSLQRQRQDRKSLFRQHPADNTKWAFAEEARDWLNSNAKQAIGDIPVIVAYLVAWCYREREISAWDAAISNFIIEFPG